MLGLAANSCAEEFHRPVFLWGRDGDDLIKGSCRSEGKTHVVELMRAVPVGTLTQFGGHHHSGGFTVSNEAIHYLEQRLNESGGKIGEGGRASESRGLSERAEIARRDRRQFGEAEALERLMRSREAIPQALKKLLIRSRFIDAELRLSQITYRLHDEINKLAPFGIGNRKPVFLFRDVKPATVRSFGKGNEHIELSFRISAARQKSLCYLILRRE